VKVIVTDNILGQLTAEIKYPQGGLVFNNTYTPTPSPTPSPTPTPTATPVTVKITGTKNLAGRDLREGDFEFGVFNKEGDLVVTGWNEEDGDIDFFMITYEAAGVFEYSIREMSGDGNGVIVDKTVYTVTITVTDNGQGQLIASITYPAGGIVFNNTYTPESSPTPTPTPTPSPTPTPTSPPIMITGSKILIGRDLADGEFEFTLYASDGITVLQKTTNVNGTITFGPFTYTEAGTYIYIVNETSHYTRKLTNGVTLDANAYSLIVEVTDDGMGGLIATQIGSFTFVNKYAPTDASAKLILQGTKILTGRKKGLIEKEFTFTITDSDGKIVRGYNDAFGKIIFKPIKYNRNDIGKTYHYTVREVIPANADPNMKYDKRVYTVKVTVGYDAETGKIMLQTDITGGPIVFKNVYTKKPVTNEDKPDVPEDIPIMTLGTGNCNLGDCCE